ncbi:hypothetical protein BOX15_Mlig034126g1 [Macrostomum lignano]|uniref:Uncharacterized protein n=1 Tax=Macrostomum lignano TaxID=282301 RepID=A0A267H5J2_9PLAT|nr:hypothetical protein BOX15_Mlig034126g1 [Macrostomum lignano]
MGQYLSSHQAVTTGNITALSAHLLLRPRQADKTRFCTQNAPLAARNGHLEVVQFLLQTVADQTIKDDCCIEATQSAARNGHLEVVKFLLETVGDQTIKDNSCIQAAQSAARNGHLEVVTFLLQTVADHTKKDHFCIQAAEFAGRNGHLEVLDFLLKTVADQTIKDDCCIQAAQSAARNGHLEVFNFLLQTVADQTMKDNCCIQAAQSAARNGHLEVVKFLVQKVADQTKKADCCIQAAQSAARNGHLEVVKFLVQTVTDQTKKADCCIQAAQSAARNGHLEVVKFSVKTVTDQTKKDDSCIKAAESAATNGHLEVVKFLVQTVTDQTKKADCCIQAAQSAARNGHLEVVKFSVKTVADQTKKDYSCIKAAESAATNGHLEVVKFLVHKVADQTKNADCCIQAAQSAARNGHLEVVKFLVHTVADQTKKNYCCIKAAESAATNGHLEVVKFLVHTVADQTKKDDCCIQAAQSAATNGHLEVVQFLVQTVVDQTKKDDCCIQAAESAARNGHLEVVKLLVQTVPDQITKNYCCIKATESAATNGHLKVVKFLVQTVADQTKKDDCCIQAAQSAATNGHLEIVKFLVQTVADSTKKDHSCIKAAQSAARNAHLEVVKFLLQTIVDHTIKDDCCITAAEYAAIHGHLEVVKFLLQTVADQTKKDDCFIHAAESAARNGHLEVVKLFLISCLSSPDQKANLRFQCAITACSRLHEDVVSYLGLEPDWLFQYSTILSFTAAMAIEGRNSVLTDTLSRMQPDHITQLLRLSIIQRHVALAVTLINKKRVSTQHVDLPDSNGATALMLAADAGHHELIEKLIDLGASVRAEDSEGRTALSRACEAGQVRAAKALMDRGADASHRDGRGLTCEQVAQRFEQRQVVRLLDRTGAGTPEARQAAAHHFDSGLHRLSDNPQQDRRLSEKLHRLLSDAGFTEQRAECQQILADWLQYVARVLTQDGRQMTGSYAEGWANSLVQVNGRTAADSDIDWTVLVDGQEFHLEGGCGGRYGSCKGATQLQVKDGHAQVSVGAGSQPAVTATACGVRPAQDTCHAIRCCSSFCEDRIEKMLDKKFIDVHLVRATRPSETNELRVSFSFQEKHIIRELSTVQGQLFTLIKFIFKRHLPLTLDTPGLKTYHAKTLLFTMLEKHGTDPETEAWQPHNLVALLKESLDMVLSFIHSSSSPDECMPHYFMPDAPLYFKNAGIGGDFDNTKARVRDRLCELRSDIGGVVEQLRRLVRPLQSEKFYFHPFTLLPLTAPPAVTEIRERTDCSKMYYKFADVYSVVHQCLSELQTESRDKNTLMRHLSLLHEQKWCKCAALCMTAMAHLKFEESEEAERLAMELQTHQVESGLQPQDIRTDKYGSNKLPEDSDWAWRFCLPCDSPPRFPFLPEFTQTLFTARLSQPLYSHLYVNFRCLSWSLQAELLRNQASSIKLEDWQRELKEDPDLEELLTLAHYSDCREHVELSLQQMEMIEKERRVAMETQDEEKIGWVRQKRWRVSNRSGSDSGAHRSMEDEERRLWTWAKLGRDGADLGRLVAMETAAEQRDSWTHAKLSRMRLMRLDRLDAAAGVLKVESQRRGRKRKAESF